MAKPPPQPVPRDAQTELQAALGDASTVVRAATQLHGVASGLNAAEAPLPARFGNYDLLEKIAQGGMGVVYRARQLDLDRIVAVKMILAGQFATDTEVERFRTEALAAAQLQHPSIVAVHEVGRIAGQHYFSMDFVEGVALGELVREKPLPAARAAAYTAEIAEAIHFAHQHGVLHRDLKPANVLIDRADRPRVTDFGLAKRIDQDSNLTATGAMLGTPSYMPPEQIRGEQDKLGPPTDVYALGVILYELLTTRPPFQGESALDTFVQVVNNDPLAPSLLNAKVPHDLETICLKCLEKEPSRRYATAAELAADLHRFLAGEPILARPISRAERAWRWCRRRPALASLTTALVLTFFVAFLLVTWQLREANAQREKAIKSYQQALAAGNKMAEVTDEMLRSRPAGLNLEPWEQKWLDDVRGVYQQLQLASHDDPALPLGIAEGNARLGRIYSVQNRGKEASEMYALAIKELDRLTAGSPSADAYRLLAQVHDWRGQALEQTGGAAARQQASREYDQAIEIAQQLARTTPSDARNRQVLARAFYNRALWRVADGDPLTADSDFHQALQLQESLAAEDPTNLDRRHELARSHKSRGSMLRQLERLDSSLAESAQALELYEALIAEADRQHQSSRDYVYESAVCALNRGNVLLQKALLADEDRIRQQLLGLARGEFSHAQNKLRPLATRFPGVPSYLEELANSYNSDGTAQSYQVSLESPDALPDAAAFAKIVATWTEAQRTYTRLVEIRPAVVEYQHRLAGVLFNLAQLEFHTDHSDDLRSTRHAVELLGDAITYQQHVLTADPHKPAARRDFARMYAVRAQAHLNLDDAPAAKADAFQVVQLTPTDAELVLMALEVLAGCLIGQEDDPQQDHKKSQDAVEAAAIVKQSLEAGIFTPEQLRSNEFLAPLLALPELARLIEAKSAAAEEVKSAP